MKPTDRRIGWWRLAVRRNPVKEEQKLAYKQRYEQAKQDGVKFWPDIIYKDLLVSFGLFILLIGLATFIGVNPEPKADPSDTSYIPRPEWYFLFLFEFLKFIPGKVEWLGTFVIPVLGVLVLFALPFLDRNPLRHWKNRLTGISVMGLIVVGMVGLTVRSVLTTPEIEEALAATTVQEKIALGEELYAIYCVECHGPDGEGGVIAGVEGLEGVELKSISSRDEMYTRSDLTLEAIIEYGQQDLGMPPYGLAYGGELKKGEIESLVTFMRYTWDDRVELPQEAAAARAVPEVGEDQVPSYETHISRIVQRYCISCHRPGKENNNYLMGTYEEILTSGDNADKNLIPGDLENSYLILTIKGESILDPATGERIIQQMPPTKLMKDEYINLFDAWVLNDMPETDAEAEALTAEE
jgi:ubiquinol-cytochrome c reductase cytochrome b subunit